MALLKTVELPSGVSASYWKITECNVIAPSQLLTVHSLLYFDQAARQSGKASLSERTDIFPYPEYLEAVNIVQTSYNKLKTLDDFQGAQDA